MYKDLGIHWASSVPAFLALACVPFPFLFYKYGASIREKCKFAAQSAAFIRKLQTDNAATSEDEEKKDETAPAEETFDDDASTEVDEPAYAPITASRTHQSTRSHASRASRASRASFASRRKSYDGNPYDIDRVNTRQSFT
jgi:hypothetical protein